MHRPLEIVRISASLPFSCQALFGGTRVAGSIVDALYGHFISCGRLMTPWSLNREQSVADFPALPQNALLGQQLSLAFVRLVSGSPWDLRVLPLHLSGRHESLIWVCSVSANKLLQMSAEFRTIESVASLRRSETVLPWDETRGCLLGDWAQELSLPLKRGILTSGIM
jgi:hypothetical protein